MEASFVAELVNEQQRFKSYLEQTPIAIAILRGPQHVYEMHNASYAEFVGHRVIIGKPAREAFPEFETQGVFELLDQVYQTGQPYHKKEALTKLFHNSSSQMRTTYRDFTYQPLRNQSGKIEGIIVTSTDVSERVLARDSISENENHFQILADTMPQIVWAASPDGQLTYANRRAREYFGIPDPTQWLGFVHPDDKERCLQIWTKSLQSGTLYETEFRLLRASDQTYRWHLARALPVRDRQGQITIWYGTCTDVTAQKDLEADLNAAKEQAEAASELKSAFLANMSHEIRTPLGAILGFTELLRQSDLGIEQKEYMEVISRSGHALTRVIDDILDISKVEAGKLEIEMMEFRFDELIQEVLILFSDKAKGKGIFLKLKEGMPFPRRVIADPTRLRQILINVVGNAVKFTSHGGVELAVRSQKAFANKHRLFVDIKDSGPGMTPEQLKRIFQPFMQADSSTNRRFGGTGLGLVLSQKLAQALGGSVRVQSSYVGQGSTFTVEILGEIPEIQTEVPMQNASTPGPSKNKRLQNIRILSVDDSTDNRLLLNLLLKKEGAEIVEACDGEEAISKARAGTFDIVLMDIQMPGMDGYEAVSVLRKQDYTVPIIALTAHAMLEERRRTLSSGFNDHITKPIHQELLIQAILDQVHRRAIV